VPDQVKVFESLVLEVSALQEKLRKKEAELDTLRRSLRSGSRGEAPTASLATRQTVDAVRALGGPEGRTVTKDAVAQKLGLKGQAALVRLGRAVQAGLLERPIKGQYRIPLVHQAVTRKATDKDT
jgi:hypothetical protein